MKICGEPDKPEVKKHIEDLDSAWDNVTALYARREENLIHAMEKVGEPTIKLFKCSKGSTLKIKFKKSKIKIVSLAHSVLRTLSA